MNCNKYVPKHVPIPRESAGDSIQVTLTNNEFHFQKVTDDDLI